MARPKPELRLSDDERRTLDWILNDPASSPSYKQRVKIVLLASLGRENQAVAKELDISEHTVGKWRRRFVSARVNGLVDQPRTGRPRSVPRSSVAEIVETTLTRPPQAGGPWSSRKLAAAMGVSLNSVRRAWRLCGIQPRRTDVFLPDPDHAFAHRVIGFAGAYIGPMDRIVALLLRPPSFKERQEGTRGKALVLPVRGPLKAPKSPAIMRLENGLEPTTMAPRPTSNRLQAFLDRLAQTTPGRLDVCLVVDGLRTSSLEPSPAVVAQGRRLEAHFAPTHMAWLNTVAHFREELSGAASPPEAARSVAAFDQAIMAHGSGQEGPGIGFDWVLPLTQAGAPLAQTRPG